MSERIVVEVKGLDKLLKKIGAEAILGKPLRGAFFASGAVLEGEAKRRAPVDQGLLEASITHQEDPSSIPLWGRMGTNVKYAPYMEYGTGRNSDGPGGKQYHNPPAKALEGWARRHGIEGGGAAVAAMIRRKGGLKPRRFLRGALEAKQAEVIRIFEDVPRKIEQEWGK